MSGQDQSSLPNMPPGPDSWPHGILLVDKPAGKTSRDVVERIQKTLMPGGRRRRRGAPRFRCGHAGTLDPLATGLLIILVGTGTRLSHYLLGHDKSYLAQLVFGATTDTLDSDGSITEHITPDFDLTSLDAALVKRRGLQNQIPPMISAIKVQGKPLYRRVRDGEEVAPPEPRPVTILELERTSDLVQDDSQPALAHTEVRVRCSSGTYIRSLARDLGDDLATCAHIGALRRLDIGEFQVSDALSGADLGDRDKVLAALMPLNEALPETPCHDVTNTEAEGLRCGHQPLEDWLERLESPPASLVAGQVRLWRMADTKGALVALGRMEADPEDPDKERPRTAVVFPDSSSQAEGVDSCS